MAPGHLSGCAGTGAAVLVAAGNRDVASTAVSIVNPIGSRLTNRAA
jgi:hypothetical protein